VTQFLSDLACAPENAPYVARGLIHNNRLFATGRYLREVAEKLKNPKDKGCRGAEGLTSGDLADLNFLIQWQPENRQN
jgi:hypothetical protein